MTVLMGCDCFCLQPVTTAKVKYLVEVLVHCSVDSSPSKPSGPKWVVGKLPKPCGVGDKGSAQVSCVTAAMVWFELQGSCMRDSYRDDC